ncbi:tyrosine recombinase XerC [Prevotella veroralis]
MKDLFLDYLKLERNYSPATVKHYRDDLKEFERFFQGFDQQLSWESVDSDIVRRWMEYMMDKGNAASSVNRRLSALRSFYRYALRRNLVVKDPVHGIQGPKRKRPLPQFLKESEMDQLLDERMWTDSYKDVLARTIIVTFYETGVRISELIGLNDKDVDYINCEIKVTGKRDKQRIIPFGDELLKTLTAYQQQRDVETESESVAFFRTEKGKRVTDEQVRQMVKINLSKVSTLKKRSPHVLRHTFATAMLNHDAGLESVKKLLGHESLSTTEIYTHTTFEQLKKVYNNAHPRA